MTGTQNNKPDTTVVTEAKSENNNKNKKRSKTLLWVSFALGIIALAWLGYYVFYLRFHEYTDDAYANGSLINLQSAIPGSVVAFYADDTDFVKEGQLLVLLDATDYQLAYGRELAALASTVLQVRQLYDSVDVNRANTESKRVTASRALYDFQNRQNLVNSQAVSKEDFTHSKDDLSIAQHDLELAESQLKVALAAAGNTSIEQHPLIEQQKERVRQAYYDLAHCAIYAPATGYVAKRAVNVGMRVTNTTNLMAIIPTDYMWVDANFKETQLTYMRIGQPATVWFDLYGSKVPFKGKVLGIASGSGSVFSIIPPQNATGNWIKIVQRLPVRVSLDAELLKKYPSRLGISAEVDINITQQDLPMLATEPSTKPVGKTRVFDIDMAKVNAEIERVIKENLQPSKP